MRKISFDNLWNTVIDSKQNLISSNLTNCHVMSDTFKVNTGPCGTKRTHLNLALHDARTMGMIKRTTSRFRLIEATRSNRRMNPYTRARMKEKKEITNTQKKLWSGLGFYVKKLTVENLNLVLGHLQHFLVEASTPGGHSRSILSFPLQCTDTCAKHTTKGTQRGRPYQALARHKNTARGEGTNTVPKVSVRSDDTTTTEKLNHWQASPLDCQERWGTLHQRKQDMHTSLKSCNIRERQAKDQFRGCIKYRTINSSTGREKRSQITNAKLLNSDLLCSNLAPRASLLEKQQG